MNENGSRAPAGISIAQCAKRAAAQGFPYRATIHFGAGHISYEVSEEKRLTIITPGVEAVIYRGRITRFTAKATVRAPA